MGEALITRRGNGAKVTIDGEKVNSKLNLMSEYVSIIDTAGVPYRMDEAQIVVFNNEIHVLGGGTVNTDQNAEKKHYKYDGLTWAEASTLPYSITIHKNVVTFNDKIHAFGLGTNGDFHYIYDGSAWTYVETQTRGFYGASPLVFNDEIHFLGGLKNSTGTNTHYKYDGSSYVEVGTLPIEISHPVAVVFNNEIHLFSETAHYKHDGSTWAEASTLPFDVILGAVVFNNEIYAFCRKECYKYDGSAWTFVSTLPGLDVFYTTLQKSIAYNNEMHVFQGIDDYVIHFIFSTLKYAEVNK